MTKAEIARRKLGVEVRFMGTIERGSNYRHVNGYSVVVDGRVSYPFLPKREAEAYANIVAAEIRRRK